MQRVEQRWYVCCYSVFQRGAARWRTMLGMSILLVATTSAVLACGGGGSGGGGGGNGNPGTTAGAYTVTVTATSGSTTAKGTVALTV
jgi:hypothetical protein